MKTELLERLLDKPIAEKTATKIDILRHEKVAGNVIKLLHSAPKNVDSPCIAIFGPWGSGKTGVLNLIERNLDSDRFQVFQIDAWHNQRGDLAILEILRVLFETAGPDLKSAMVNLLWALSINTATSLIPSLLPFGIKPEEIAEAATDAYPKGFPVSRDQLIKNEFSKLVSHITEQGRKRLVIGIDNLDRCRPEAALQILETLNLITHVPHCAFLVTADQQVLVSFLNREYSGTDFSGTKYLEKVFPFYYRLPDPWVAWKQEETEIEGDQIASLLQYLIDPTSPWRREAETFSHALALLLATPRVAKSS